MSTDTQKAETLLELARERFGVLTAADEKLFHSVALGEWADYQTGDEEKDKPANADKWGNDRILAANRIAWLCSDKQASDLVMCKGIKVRGACIREELDLDDIDINFWLQFDVCTLSLGINLRQSSVKGLLLSGSRTGPIDADGIKVTRSILFRDGIKSEGEVRLSGAEIGGNFECDKGQFINAMGYALNADSIKVAGSVFLRHDFKAEGEVLLMDAKIGGILDCTNGRFSNPTRMAISADRIKVTKSTFLDDGFRAEGEVGLLGAEIGGNLSCVNGRLSNPGRDALSADGIKVEGAVFLRRGFRAEGTVRLLGAKIGGNLECNTGQFVNPGGIALYCDGISVAGNVFLRDEFKAEGEVRLPGAEIGGLLQCSEVAHANDMTLVLSAARVGNFRDDKNSWPEKGNIHLDGLLYERMDDRAPRDAKTRIEWLRRQPGDKFFPQPYEYLAKVLRESGHEREGKIILIAKYNDPARRKQMRWYQTIWYWIHRLTVAFGYRPEQALLWMAGFFIIGLLVFGFGDAAGYMKQVSDKAPVFKPFIYSLDTLLPIVDLQQEKYWFPASGFPASYLWVHIMAGWLLVSVFVAGLSRSVRS